MFSAPTLLIIAALCLVALTCSIFPVAPTWQASVLYFFAAILCWFLPAIFGLVIGVIATALVIFDAIMSRRKADVRRSLPNQLARGVPSSFRIATKNAVDGKKSNVVPTVIRQPSCADIVISNKQATNDLVGTITANRRGLHTIPPYATRIYGPLRLAVWHRPYAKTQQIKVFPDLPAANRLAHSIQRGRFASAGLKRRGPLGLGTNFESVRDYFPDDDMRLVNWNATARTGKPMTNQYRVEQDRDVVVLVDSGRLMTAPLPLSSEKKFDEFEYRNAENEQEQNVPLVTRLDIALDALCGLVSVADVMGDRSGVIAFNSTIRKHLKPRRAGAHAVIQTIYDLEPIPVDSDFEAACSRVGKSKRSFVLILTDIMDEQSCKSLIRGLKIIVKKHRVVVASIIDPDVQEILDLTENTYDISALKYGANEMANATLNAIAAIKDAGAEVVYCNHEDLMLESVRTYLSAKARGSF
ncbi:MAG: DUF58 domain-containing protein [Acidimicrobiia bacterium]